MKRTDSAISIAAVGLAAWELYTLINKDEGDTISESIWNITRERPILPFAMGMLMGHFFWTPKVSEVSVNLPKKTGTISAEEAIKE